MHKIALWIITSAKKKQKLSSLSSSIQSRGFPISTQKQKQSKAECGKLLKSIFQAV